MPNTEVSEEHMDKFSCKEMHHRGIACKKFMGRKYSQLKERVTGFENKLFAPKILTARKYDIVLYRNSTHWQTLKIGATGKSTCYPLWQIHTVMYLTIMNHPLQVHSF